MITASISRFHINTILTIVKVSIANPPPPKYIYEWIKNEDSVSVCVCPHVSIGMRREPCSRSCSNHFRCFCIIYAIQILRHSLRNAKLNHITSDESQLQRNSWKQFSIPNSEKDFPIFVDISQRTRMTLTFDGWRNTYSHPSFRCIPKLGKLMI